MCIGKCQWWSISFAPRYYLPYIPFPLTIFIGRLNHVGVLGEKKGTYGRNKAGPSSLRIPSQCVYRIEYDTNGQKVLARSAKKL